MEGLVALAGQVLPCSGSPCRKTRCATVAGWKVMGIMGACTRGDGVGQFQWRHAITGRVDATPAVVASTDQLPPVEGSLHMPRWSRVNVGSR